jgi:hypothetical protein
VATDLPLSQLCPMKNGPVPIKSKQALGANLSFMRQAF